MVVGGDVWDTCTPAAETLVAPMLGDVGRRAERRRRKT